MTRQLILVLGGARSGKSTYAQNLAQELGGRDVLYVATAQALDDEMKARIRAHQAERPAGWRTLETPTLAGTEAATAVAAAAEGAQVVLLDCVTLLASNALMALDPAVGSEEPGAQGPAAQDAEAAVATEVAALLAAYGAGGATGAATWIVVSNEVGMGLVPPYPLGRAYRDALGRANQQLAAAADQVTLMVAGIALRIK